MNTIKVNTLEPSKNATHEYKLVILATFQVL